MNSNKNHTLNNGISIILRIIGTGIITIGLFLLLMWLIFPYRFILG